MRYLVFSLAFASSAAWEWGNLDYGIPGACDQIVKREGYALGYSWRYGQPLWVSYRLTADEVTNRVVRRSGHFYCDSEIRFGAVMPNEYANTGYVRGHLAPVAVMRFNTNVMRQSFSMGTSARSGRGSTSACGSGWRRRCVRWRWRTGQFSL